MFIPRYLKLSTNCRALWLYLSIGSFLDFLFDTYISLLFYVLTLKLLIVQNSYNAFSPACNPSLVFAHNTKSSAYFNTETFLSPNIKPIDGISLFSSTFTFFIVPRRYMCFWWFWLFRIFKYNFNWLCCFQENMYYVTDNTVNIIWLRSRFNIFY